MDAELGDPRPNSTASSGSAANMTAPSSTNMTATNSTNMTAPSAANMSSPSSGTNSGPPSVANSSGAVSAANSAVNGVANKAASPRACALPLPDATQLDWSALVHTATRAMLQICEEHQFPSLDNTESSIDASLSEPALDAWPETTQANNCAQAAAPAGTTSAMCACGLAGRVAALEAAAAHSARLQDEVRRLRRHNARLREESARAVWQLRHFTQWLKRTVDRQ
ncbi:hypothetical protein JYU34_008422 [Plutella xylostella]|uniref:Signal-induced proliferation-associated 1-like protein C-terminal domain-containing protein n=1 Tax=Plutella xylostella TaxID=51655 RepID=A0ABQ7QKX4_PLUXY|nr:hypothetical protein JYU34_008422 [Plutella xylostella]